MAEAILRSEKRAQVFQQCARAGRVFKLFDPLPSDIKPTVAGDEIADERLMSVKVCERA